MSRGETETNSTMRSLLSQARATAQRQSTVSSEERQAALLAVAREITAQAPAILAANARDLEGAQSLSPALRDRLLLTAERLAQMSSAVAEVSAQPDPLGQRRALGLGRSGVQIFRQRVPLGVLAVIYEARPNVTAECAALALKSGNVIVLRGGKEAAKSNLAIYQAIRTALATFPQLAEAVLFVTDPDHAAVTYLLQAVGLVDLVIPRGGDKLMRLVEEQARVPVVRHGQGICHVYVDAAADAAMASEIAYNSKVHRPGVCNAMETLLIHEGRLHDVLAQLGPRLKGAGVELRADPSSRAVLAQLGVTAAAAAAADYATEFLDLILVVRTVASLDAALDHIAQYGTHHTAAIVTTDAAAAEQFCREVDASCVLWNASTRLNDGGELGLGAEMGISTSKMHAYGPMGANELTTEKLVVIGTGQIRR